MKISFSTLGCPRWSWREILATACDLGYGGVEVRGVGNDISVPSIPAFSDENLDKTKAELARLNLAIPPGQRLLHSPARNGADHQRGNPGLHSPGAEAGRALCARDGDRARSSARRYGG